MIPQERNKLQKGRTSKAFYLSIFLVTIFPFLLQSCKDKTMPLPYAYYRIYLPEAKYHNTDPLYAPCRFLLSDYAKIEQHKKQEKGWFDIVYPSLRGKIHCSYKNLNENLQELSEESRRFVYAHTNQADGIEELFFEHPENHVFAVLYNLKGNVASPVQFVVTDSTENFFRGALYFETVPNKDSIAPVLDYVRADIIRLIESFDWKK